jgi:hypothetical protein
VTGEPARLADAHAAENQRTRIVERMNVESLPDADH